MNPELAAILQSLIRIGLSSDNPAFRKQVERLSLHLKDEHESATAANLDRLLQASPRSAAIQPSKVSPAFMAWNETLSAQTNPPVDKETGAPLAEIIFPDSDQVDFPVLEDNLRSATDSIIEEWNHRELLQAAGVPPTATCLLYGPPGTGKTHLALALGRKLNLPVVLARLDGVISSFLGTTGRNMANLFSFANRYSCVLLLDEFDAIAKLRDDPHEVGEIKRVVNTLLQNIDLRRKSGLTIAITNHEQLLDSAVWRRFDVRIAFQAPSFLERQAIVRRYFQETDKATTLFLAWISDGMTGADIETMSRHVKRFRALNPDTSLVSALKQYFVTQAGRVEFRNHAAISSSLKHLAKTIHSAAELSLTQREIASILMVSQAQVARWLKEI